MRTNWAAVPAGVLALVLACVLPLVHATANYFEVTTPTSDVQWVDGQANLVQWEKALDDGIPFFDVELTRLSDGIKYIAESVPASVTSLNVYLDDIPVADDYFLVFVNITYGYLYASSQQFSIGASANSSAPAPTPDAAAPTITISGAPNPTEFFATTFPASGALPAWPGAHAQLVSVAMAVAMCLVGGALAVW